MGISNLIEVGVSNFQGKSHILLSLFCLIVVLRALNSSFIYLLIYFCFPCRVSLSCRRISNYLLL